MQGPTHMLAGIALQKITDHSLEKIDKVLPEVFHQHFSVKPLRWLIIPFLAFFVGQGFLDLLTKITFHDVWLDFSKPLYLLIPLFNIVLTVGVFKRWVIRDWKNLKAIFFWKKENRLLWQNYRYILGPTFSWWLPDGEVVYFWMKTGHLDLSLGEGHIFNNASLWLWKQIPAVGEFISSLPNWYYTGRAFFVEFGIVLFLIFIVHSFDKLRR